MKNISCILDRAKQNIETEKWLKQLQHKIISINGQVHIVFVDKIIK